VVKKFVETIRMEIAKMDRTMKGIFHPHWKDFGLCRSLGFTHVEVALGIGYQTYSELTYALEKCREAGLNAFINPGFDRNAEEAMNFLRMAPINENDIIFLCDEPNDRKIPRSQIAQWADLVEKEKSIPFFTKTMITLTASKPWEYANLTDIVSVDYYRDYKKLDLFLLGLKMCFLRHIHHGKVFGIPGVKGSPAFLWEQYKFWKKCQVDGILWYSWTPDQEQPPWFPKSLDQLPEIAETLKLINAEP